MEGVIKRIAQLLFDTKYNRLTTERLIQGLKEIVDDYNQLTDEHISYE